MRLVGNDHFSFTGSVSDLAGYGVQAAEGTVGNVRLGVLASDSSTVGIAGGSVHGGIQAYDTSTANITGGSVDWLNANESSMVNISSGTVYRLSALDGSESEISGGSVDEISVYDNSTVNISGGSITGEWGELKAYGSSTVNVSAGSVRSLGAWNGGTINLSGGDVGTLRANQFSTVTFLGLDFVLGEGLEWGEGYELIGTGILSGQWLNGARWHTDIEVNHTTATILLIPEPVTLVLLGLGGLALRVKKRR